MRRNSAKTTSAEINRIWTISVRLGDGANFTNEQLVRNSADARENFGHELFNDQPFSSD